MSSTELDRAQGFSQCLQYLSLKLSDPTLLGDASDFSSRAIHVTMVPAYWTLESVTDTLDGLEEWKRHAENREPSRTSELDRDTLCQALRYFVLVASALGCCEEDNMRRALFELFHEHSDAVVHWLDILLSFGSYHVLDFAFDFPALPVLIVTMVAHALQEIVSVTTREKGLWYTQEYIRLVIRKLYQCEQLKTPTGNTRRTHYFPFLSEDTAGECQCPIQWLVEDIFISSEESLAVQTTLIRTLGEERSLFDILAMGTKYRVSCLADQKKTKMDTLTLVDNLRSMARIIERVYSLGQVSSVVKQCLPMDLDLQDVVDRVDSIVNYVVFDSNNGELMAGAIGAPVRGLLFAVMDDDRTISFGKRSQNFAVLFNLFGKTAAYSQGKASWSRELCRWTQFTSHPTIARHIVEAWLKRSQPISGPSPNKDPQGNGTWKCIWDAITETVASYKATKEDGLGICDNAMCTSTHRISKVCVKCLQVAYCSDECQKQDWETFHRAECHSACEDRICGKSMGMVYSVKKKAYHLRVLEEKFNGHCRTCAKCVSGDTVVTVDLAERKTRCRERKEDEWENEGMQMYQDFWRPRFLKQFQHEGLAAEGARLGELILPYTVNTNIYITAALKRSSNGQEEGEGKRYRVLYGVARFGRENPDGDD
ncbi:hypothetical protein NMY22_g7449 [Coprinellus aureogranulatus]|nr:hypothetical protein NMY22_g7449 [Coprinellus aureogranulatus]